MIPAMQVGPFRSRAQTFRNLLAAPTGVPENSICQTGYPGPNLSRPQPQNSPLAMSATLSLASEMERIANAIGTEQGESTRVSLSAVAAKIAKNLGVRADEVAILAVSTRWRHLHFLVPEALKNVGFIPLSSTSALTARTARDSRPEIENNFAAAKHATVFEGIRTADGSSGTIQKMVSAPIL